MTRFLSTVDWQISSMMMNGSGYRYAALLLLPKSPIHRQNLSRHKVRRFQGRQPGVRDLGGGAAAAGRSGLDHPLPAIIDIVERNYARRNGVYRDLRGEGFCQGARQHDDSGFRRAVVHMFRPGANAAERADVDDPSAAGLLHEARCILAAEEDGFQIHGMNEVPILFGDFERVEAGE